MKTWGIMSLAALGLMACQRPAPAPPSPAMSLAGTWKKVGNEPAQGTNPEDTRIMEKPFVLSIAKDAIVSGSLTSELRYTYTVKAESASSVTLAATNTSGLNPGTQIDFVFEIVDPKTVRMHLEGVTSKDCAPTSWGTSRRCPIVILSRVK